MTGSTTSASVEVRLEDLDRAELHALVADPKSSPEVLDALARMRDPHLAAMVSRNVATSGPTLARLASSGTLVRARVAAHRSTPPEVLTRFAWSDDLWVNSRAADNPSLPVEVLVALSQGTAAEQSRAARSPQTPGGVLEGLVHDHAQLVASNPSTPPSLLTALATDSAHAWVVVGNPSAPVEALRAALPFLNEAGLGCLAQHANLDWDLLLVLPAFLVPHEVLATHCREEVREDVLSLADEWEGSVSDLLEAVRLVRR